MNFPLIIIIQILLFISIFSQENENDNLELKGIYRIDSLLNNYSLADEYNNLQFFDIKNKSEQIFRFIKTENDTFFIEIKKNNKKLGVNILGHIIAPNNLKDRYYQNSTQWNIIKIKDNQYIIQNTWNQKFMENFHNFIQCINDLPYPIQEHISEIPNNFIFSFFRLFYEVDISAEDEKIIEKEPIDVVIKYIDLTDKTLNRSGIKQIQKDEDNEEMRYSLRSILQYIPWVRKIFIVMPNEKVKYLKPENEIKEKIVYVKDKEVFGFDSANIYAFTFQLFRLEKFGLSNNFIYMDDDFFIGQKLNKSNFFYYEKEEKRVVPSLLNVDFCVLNKEKILDEYNILFQEKENIGVQSFKAWVLSLVSSEKFFIDFYKDRVLINPTPSHNAISYNIQDLKEIYDLVVNNYQYANDFLNSIERHILTLQTQHFVDLYEINVKHRKINTIKNRVIPMNQIKLHLMNIELFAINTGGDRFYTQQEYKYQKEMMQLRFPVATSYEISENQEYKLSDEEIEKNYLNALRHNFTLLTENEYISLVANNNKKSLMINIYKWLVIILTVLIITLFYLFNREKNKIKNAYSQIYDIDNKKKLEIFD